MATTGGTLPELSLTEWVVAALLAEGPAHGFALAKELRPDADVGRILTVHRPLVYRALDRVIGAGLAEPTLTEPGDAGPNRTIHRLTRAGTTTVERWLDEPVHHVRELRIEFLLKLRLQQRRDRDPHRLVDAQRVALAATFAQLTRSADADVVMAWRRHNAIAAQAFLDELATRT